MVACACVTNLKLVTNKRVLEIDTSRPWGGVQRRYGNDGWTDGCLRGRDKETQEKEHSSCFIPMALLVWGNRTNHWTTASSAWHSSTCNEQYNFLDTISTINFEQLGTHIGRHLQSGRADGNSLLRLSRQAVLNEFWPNVFILSTTLSVLVEIMSP